MARVERRLAAIVAADVVGHRRLMRVGEEAALAAHEALRKGVIDPSIAARHGDIAKTMGDGLLIGFSSVVEAVRNAVEVRERVAKHGLEVPRKS